MAEKTADHVGDEWLEMDATPRAELIAQIVGLEGMVQALNDVLSSLSARLLRNVDDLREEVRSKVGHEDRAAIQKELESIDARIDDIVDELGYGESLDVAKVPPSILEPAYQTILDDAVAALEKAHGVHDAEQYVLRSLEQVRLKTSGSELFQYVPHQIRVGVAKALEKGLVSARQVQMTFEELRRHLLEPIPHHAPRNFRALVKIKSQEYAVHQALTLTKETSLSAEELESLRARVDRLEEQVAGALRDLQAFAGTLHHTLVGLATQESVEALTMRFGALEERLRPHPSGRGVPTDDVEPRVLSALDTSPRTRAALAKELGIEEGILREVLADLERRGLVSSSVRGRHTVYRKEERNDA